MDYYDGNTVTALWNYAQHFAMSDNSFGTTFGPSTPGALNLISGQTHGVDAEPGPTGRAIANGTVIGDPRPDPVRRLLDDTATNRGAMTGTEHRRPAERQGRHLGLVPGRLRADRVNSDGQGRLRRDPHRTSAGVAVDRLHPAPRAVPVLRVDGQPAPPAAERRSAMIGTTDQANHQYDLTDF